ncbi:hypothetical protein I2I11_05410 [Pontibacter sp. 172403-2]|uniref:hypothetical protein n=1 Tax=Pontibacter rufus TaxID=2791028 RepID=UPI0018AFD44A|nr:hypothetical protein [Pontibacter sp. 172403-2]MBF9252717.1 hypothetical protein [Pontibacter sp. 172403-2]
MKKLLLLGCAFLLTIAVTMAQAPQAMNYQGIARDQAGNLIANKAISLRISIVEGGAEGQTVYTEVHRTTTSAFGSFSLQIGRGTVEKGKFESIAWGSSNQYLRIELDAGGGTNYKLMGSSELLSVPYAYHAGTASKLLNGLSASDSKHISAKPGIPAQVWSLFGNSETDPAEDRLGTTDYVDLILITNNEERLKITKDGDINIKTNLNVGNNADIGNDLTVRKNVYLNTVGGETTNNGPFTVARASATYLTGTLTVDKATDLNSTLNADGATTLGNTLNVAGATALANTLTVDNATNLKSTLGVTGSTSLGSTLGVTGATTLGSTLGVNGATTLRSSLGVSGVTNLGSSLGVTGATSLNNTLSVGGATTLNNTLSANGMVTVNASLSGGDMSPGAYPLRVMGSDQGIFIKVNGESNNDKNYISFVNGNNVLVGKIEGQTLSELKNGVDYGWQIAMNAANIAFIAAEGIATAAQLDAAEAVVMAVDGIVATGEMAKHIIEMENQAGVTYESGSGDYAEWLRRADQNEKLTFGDIIGVTGGKITRNTSAADHFMVVSMSPIVLGNSPKAGEEESYEKVAFMGQVPVKVVGNVSVGDYIVPSGNNDGFGVAIHPADMILENYKKIVGVAWSAAKSNESFSLVNVAVGINANDMAQKLVQQQAELEHMRGKVNSILTYLNTKDENFKETLLPAPAESGSSHNSAALAAAPADAASQTNTMLTAPTPSTAKNYKAAAEMFEGEAGVLTASMAKMRAQYEERGIDITQYPELNKLLTDEKYFLETLKKLEGKK